MTTSALKDYSSHVGVLLLYGVATVLLRAPFWFTDRFNWDESTFVVVGASLLDGHLPYTAAWDIKPPFTFGWMALFLTAFGDSIVSVRLGGALFVLGTAFFVYLIALRFAPRGYSVLAGLVQIALASLYASGQSTMSEHLAMLPLMAALYFVMTGVTKPLPAAVVGALIAIAALSRMNMAYIAVALGLLIVAAPGYRDLRERLVTAVAYAFGGLAIAGLLGLVYLIAGHWEALWFSVFEASLAYASEQLGMIDSAKNIAKSLLDITGPAPYLRLAVLFLAIAGALLLLGTWKRHPDARYALVVFFVALATLVFSILSSGSGHGHYILQLFPFLSILAAVTLSRLAPSGRPRVAAIGLTLVAIAVGLGPALDKAQFLWRRHQEGLPLTHGPSYWAADLIRSQGLDDYSIYAMERNLLYWLLDKPIPDPLVTHPSNIIYPVLLKELHGPDATPAMVLSGILAGKPTFIIRREAYNYLEGNPDADRMLTEALQRYTAIGRNGDLVVYMANDAREARL